MTRFFWQKQDRYLPPSQISHSPVSGRLCWRPARTGSLPRFALFVISEELLALLSLLHLDYSSPPSDPKRTMSKNAVSFFLSQLITESGAVSSLVPPRAHDTRGIAPSLNCYSNLSISAIKEAAPWKSNRVFAMRYLTDMSATRSRLKGMGPLIAAGSAVHQH